MVSINQSINEMKDENNIVCVCSIACVDKSINQVDLRGDKHSESSDRVSYALLCSRPWWHSKVWKVFGVKMK
jgi:hypothetical protein